MGIIKSVLIKGFIKKNIKKTLFFLYQLCILKIGFVLILPIRAVLINAIIKTGKTLALTIEGLFPLFRIARKSSCKFSQLLNLAQAWDNLRKYNAKKL